MKRKIAITVLCGVLVYLSTVIVEIENQRYALVVGMCRNPDPALPADRGCLKTVKTRTHWGWHLYYALIDRY